MTFITTIKLELLFFNIEYTLFPHQTRIYQGTFFWNKILSILNEMDNIHLV